MECKGERAQRRLDELLSEIDDWATEAFWTGFYSGCEHERDLINEINWLQAELHGAELKAERKPRKTCHRELDEHHGIAELHRCGEIETYGLSKCSACGAVTLIASYCPFCGAKVVRR